MVWAMDDFLVPALPWSHNTHDVLSSVLLIQAVISSRILWQVPSKQIFHVFNPAPPIYGILFRSKSSAVPEKAWPIPIWESTTLSPKALPNTMHEHQHVACSLVMELLQEFVKDVVVALYARIGFRNKNFEQPHPLYKKGRINQHQFHNVNKCSYRISYSVNTLEWNMNTPVFAGICAQWWSSWTQYPTVLPVWEKYRPHASLKGESKQSCHESSGQWSSDKHKSDCIARKSATGQPWKEKKGQSMWLAHKGGSMHGPMSVQALLVQQNTWWQSCPR